jgi:hypothetical protein
MRDLQRCCSMCRDKTLCVHELEDKPRQAMWPKYCPNEYTLACLPIKKATSATIPSASNQQSKFSRPLLF